MSWSYSVDELARAVGSRQVLAGRVLQEASGYRLLLEVFAVDEQGATVSVERACAPCGEEALLGLVRTAVGDVLRSSTPEAAR